MQQVKWFERRFAPSAEQNIFPSLIERLAGTPVRLRYKICRIPADIYTDRIGSGWSIQEHVGHLSDIEELWQRRLEGMLRGDKEMLPADLQNRKTHEAGHNDVRMKHLIDRFDAVRSATLVRLAGLNEEDIFKSALHPRLQTPMTVQGLFTFVADHDDHHLAAITALWRR